MQLANLHDLVLESLDDMKARDVVVIDVQKVTSVTDLMIICSGTSNRHVKSISENLVSTAKHQSVLPLGVEGANEGEWVLVDLGDILVHIMLPKVREFYSLEKLWAGSQTVVSLDN